MSRRVLGTAILAVFVLGCGTHEGADGRGDRARNLIWISLDTLRADRLGCYGYARPTTPNLDAFAAASVVFEDASSPAPWTKPAHASLFTGLLPHHHGVAGFENPLAPGVIHVASWMAQHGFQTLAVVSNSVLTLHDLPGGFQTFDYVERASGPEPSDVTRRAIQRLAEREPTKPFFVFVHYNDLHARYRSLPRYEAQFSQERANAPSGRGKEFLEHFSGEQPFDAADVAHLSDLYDAALRQLDDQLAELFAYLAEAGLLAESLVVVTSDHGEEFFDHGSVNHGMTQYQEMVRIPLLFRGPGLAAGRRARPAVSLLDVLPTSLSVLGLPVPPGLDGRDLSGLLQRAGTEIPVRLLHFDSSCAEPTRETTIPRPGRRYAIREGDLKLHWDEGSDAVQLYDLGTDPAERTDLGGERGADAARLLEELRRFRASAGAERRDAGLGEEDLRRLQALGYAQGGEDD